MRAISVLGNAKSDSHRKTHRVELDGTGRKYMHLTRGDLEHESVREVSKVRISEEACRKVSGAKGRRVTRAGPEPSLQPRRAGGRKSRDVATTAATPCGAEHCGEWILIGMAGLVVELRQ